VAVQCRVLDCLPKELAVAFTRRQGSACGSSVLNIMIGIGLLMNVSMRRYYVSPARTTGLLTSM